MCKNKDEQKHKHFRRENGPTLNLSRRKGIKQADVRKMCKLHKKKFTLNKLYRLSGPVFQVNIVKIPKFSWSRCLHATEQNLRKVGNRQRERKRERERE